MKRKKRDVTLLFMSLDDMRSATLCFYDFLIMSQAVFVFGNKNIANKFIRLYMSIIYGADRDWILDQYSIDLANRGETKDSKNPRFHRLKGGYGGFIDFQYGLFWLHLCRALNLLTLFCYKRIRSDLRRSKNYFSLLRYYVQSSTKSPADSSIPLVDNELYNDSITSVDALPYFAHHRVIGIRQAIAYNRDFLVELFSWGTNNGLL